MRAMLFVQTSRNPLPPFAFAYSCFSHCLVWESSVCARMMPDDREETWAAAVLWHPMGQPGIPLMDTLLRMSTALLMAKICVKRMLWW